MTSVHQAVNDLAGAFEEFKFTNDHRLQSLEKTGAVDGLVEQKLSRLNQEMDRAQHHLNKLQLSLKRPGVRSLEDGNSDDDQERKSAFFSYVRKGDESKLHQLEAKALSIGSDKDGGYMIPQVVSDRISRTLKDLSPIRALANTITISSSAVELLVDKEGPEVGWVTEMEERKETTSPSLAKVRIPVHELYARPRATQKLLDDARVNIEEWLAGRVATQMAKAENSAFLFGDGIKQPKGILSYDTVAEKDAEWGKLSHLLTGKKGALGDKGADILIDAIQGLKAEYHRGACWLMSPSAHATIRKLKDRNGLYIWQPGLSLDSVPTLLGYKVHIIDDMPALTPETASNSIIFGNLQEGYQIVDREGIHTLRDPYSAKPYVEFYTTKRVGGDVIDFNALKIVRCADA